MPIGRARFRGLSVELNTALILFIKNAQYLKKPRVPMLITIEDISATLRIRAFLALEIHIPWRYAEPMAKTIRKE